MITVLIMVIKCLPFFVLGCLLGYNHKSVKKLQTQKMLLLEILMNMDKGEINKFAEMLNAKDNTC